MQRIYAPAMKGKTYCQTGYRTFTITAILNRRLPANMHTRQQRVLVQIRLRYGSRSIVVHI